MIQWLNKDDSTGLYEKDYCDFTELDCILLEVKLDRSGRGVYRLPDPQLTRIQNAIDGQFSESEEEESEDEGMYLYSMSYVFTSFEYLHWCTCRKDVHETCISLAINIVERLFFVHFWLDVQQNSLFYEIL